MSFSLSILKNGIVLSGGGERGKIRVNCLLPKTIVQFIFVRMYMAMLKKKMGCLVDTLIVDYRKF